MSEYREEELSGKSLQELRELAKANHIKGLTGKKKNEIVDLILQNQSTITDTQESKPVKRFIFTDDGRMVEEQKRKGS